MDSLKCTLLLNLSFLQACGFLPSSDITSSLIDKQCEGKTEQKIITHSTGYKDFHV